MVLFNDGDQTPDKHKKLGETGGVYISSSASYTRGVLNDMKRVMYRGDGGDIEENDVEAILYGLDKVKDFDELVLIADNHSGIRDRVLIDSISHPVHIVLCGTDSSRSIHIDYLNMALKTGGTLHTIEDDIENIHDIELGDTLKVGHYGYVLGESGFFSGVKADF